jgi:hypothetical protein
VVPDVSERRGTFETSRIARPTTQRHIPEYLIPHHTAVRSSGRFVGRFSVLFRIDLPLWHRRTDVTGTDTRPLGHVQDSPTVHRTVSTALYHFTGTAHKQLCCPLTVITVPFHWHSTQTAVLSTDCYHCTISQHSTQTAVLSTDCYHCIISLAQHTNACAVR